MVNLLKVSDTNKKQSKEEETHHDAYNGEPTFHLNLP